MTKAEQIKSLVLQLNKARKDYYITQNSTMSDFEYDKLYDQLESLERETNIVLSNSPTQNVGYLTVSELEQVRHSHLMLSLNKTKDIKDLIKFIGNKEAVLSHKLDGLTILLTYENGNLVQAETRGNGEIGEIITHNAKVFSNIPLTIPYKGKCEFEGEAIITYDDFERINNPLIEKAKREATQKGLTGSDFDKYVKDNSYKNPRNLVSGSVRQLDSSVTATRNVRFICWKIPTNALGKTVIERFNVAEKFGFDTVDRCVLTKDMDLQSIIDSSKLVAEEQKIPIDGLVLTYDDIEYGLSLGNTIHHPLHSIAFKFYDDIFPSKLLDVDWTMGKTGVITPTIIFEPIEIEGTTVERASVHNVSIFKNLHFTKGCTCYIYKANKIIPQCDCTDNDGNGELEIPTVCPICGEKTVITKENDTENLICPNEYCQGKLLKKLCHFVSRDAINIDGLSESTLDKFVQLSWIKCLADVFRLHLYKTSMLQMDGFGKKSVEKLLSAIDNSKNTTLDRFLHSLSIPLIGKAVSKDIAKFCDNDIDKFCDYAINKPNIFLTIDGFGDVMLEEFKKWVSKNWIEFLGLKDIFRFKKGNENIQSVNLKGMTFVITGSLEHFNNRDELKELLENNGAKVSGSVSSKTTALVNNDIDSNSSKNVKAKSLGIPIISEQELISTYLS